MKKIITFVVSLSLIFFSCKETKQNLSKTLSNKVIKRDSVLYKIQKEFDVLDYIKPSNYKNEKRIFFKLLAEDKNYNPVFQYNKNVRFVDSLLTILSNLPNIDKKEPLNDILNEKKDELVLQLKLIKSIGNDSVFTRLSNAIYGFPNKKLYEYAVKILKKNKQTKISEEEYSVQYAKEYFEKVLSDLGLKDWKVIVTDEISSKANVNNNKKMLQLNAEYKFSKTRLKQLKFHEIGVHIRRSENGNKYPLKLLTLGLANYLSTEEGLASYNEEINGCLSNNTLRKYCGRVVAVYLSKNNSFSEIFDQLKKYNFSDEDAFIITYRVKRGLISTSNIGGYSKDYVYLKGLLEIKDFIKKGGTFNDIIKFGKVNLKHIQPLKEFFNE